MKFLRNLIGKKRRDDSSRRPAGVDSLEQSYRDTVGSIHSDADEQAVTDILSSVNNKVAAPKPEATNIWDVEDTGGSSALPETAPDLPSPAPAEASAAASRSPARARRTKTRLIGFEKSDGDVVGLFDDAPTPDAPKAPPAMRAKFPVGWVVVADGPGRGECFSLASGMSQIGRGEDQAVKLDFGDNSISRSNHAAIVFDTETSEFLLGHGGKSNIVRLNDKPLISNEVLKSGDVIRLGETVLRFVSLCDKNFNWTNGASGEDEDVAIA
ncbi:FHA domain-containing protein [Yoonia tamlensis]|uniref:FHA domain-containing protein n=1 Tax=Yoonia tamlensis TaxID=390270 RepID=A0A1I6I110_9RHOB|nr:FHA domain-containing protein [Yoonia tamlensis]SFR60412.1 FHA domain-containing protein [Yoonia tamlensis]